MRDTERPNREKDMTLHTQELTAVIKPISALINESTIVRQSRGLIRIHNEGMDRSKLDHVALRELIHAGMTVKVYAGSFISRLELVDGQLHWEFRVTSKYRDHLVIEIGKD